MDTDRHLSTSAMPERDTVRDSEGDSVEDRLARAFKNVVVKPDGRIVSYAGKRAPFVLYDPKWQKYYDAYMTGMTLEQVGDLYGVTRERVRQLCNKVDRAGFEAEKQRRKDEAAARKIARRERGYRNTTCYLCGKEIKVKNQGVRVKRRFCSPEHREIFTRMSIMVDEERHEGHRLALVKSPSYAGSKYSENVRNGTVKQYKRNRWLVEGSLVFWCAVKCCVNNWPIFQEFPLQIQKQVRDYVDRLGESE